MGKSSFVKYECDLCGAGLHTGGPLPVDWIEISWQTEKMNVIETRHLCHLCVNLVRHRLDERAAKLARGPLPAAADR